MQPLSQSSSYKTTNYTYSGETSQNLAHGNGSIKWPDGSSYDGEISNGLACGEGKMELPLHSDGKIVIIGNFFNGVLCNPQINCASNADGSKDLFIEICIKNAPTQQINNWQFTHIKKEKDVVSEFSSTDKEAAQNRQPFNEESAQDTSLTVQEDVRNRTTSHKRKHTNRRKSIPRKKRPTKKSAEQVLSGTILQKLEMYVLDGQRFEPWQKKLWHTTQKKAAQLIDDSHEELQSAWQDAIKKEWPYEQIKSLRKQFSKNYYTVWYVLFNEFDPDKAFEKAVGKIDNFIIRQLNALNNPSVDTPNSCEAVPEMENLDKSEAPAMSAINYEDKTLIETIKNARPAVNNPLAWQTHIWHFQLGFVKEQIKCSTDDLKRIWSLFLDTKYLQNTKMWWPYSQIRPLEGLIDNTQPWIKIACTPEGQTHPLKIEEAVKKIDAFLVKKMDALLSTFPADIAAVTLKNVNDRAEQTERQKEPSREQNARDENITAFQAALMTTALQQPGKQDDATLGGSNNSNLSPMAVDQLADDDMPVWPCLKPTFN